MLFLASVGFWNFLGAGVFGFLINLPVVSYYQIGTYLTSNHGHAAMMGVYGMLALALMVFCLRYLMRPEDWSDRLVGYSFWTVNIGLMLMVFANLFPVGVLQLADVVTNGYWHARSEFFREASLPGMDAAAGRRDLRLRHVPAALDGGAGRLPAAARHGAPWTRRGPRSRPRCSPRCMPGGEPSSGRTSEAGA